MKSANLSPRKIITFQYLQKLFGEKSGKHSAYHRRVWFEIVCLLSLEESETISCLNGLISGFKKLGGGDEINPWIDLKSAFNKMSKVERLRIRRDADAYSQEHAEEIIKSYIDGTGLK